MPELDPITGAPDRGPDPPSRQRPSSHARGKRSSTAATGGRRPSPRPSELEQIGRRFEVALRHPFHSADRDPAQVEELRRRGRRLLEKQARHAAERRHGRREEPGGFSLMHLRDRLVGTVRSLLTRQDVSPASRRPTR